MTDIFSATAFSFGLGVGMGTMLTALLMVAVAEALKKRRAAIAIEAQRAVTTQIGTVRSTKARAESIAQTPIPSSRERK